MLLHPYKEICSKIEQNPIKANLQNIPKKKTRILHQHRVWERNYRDCTAKLQIIFGFCKFFMQNVKFLTYFGRVVLLVLKHLLLVHATKYGVINVSR